MSREPSLIVKIWRHIRTDCDYTADGVAAELCADPAMVRFMLDAGVSAGIMTKRGETYRKVPAKRRTMRKSKQYDWVDKR